MSDFPFEISASVVFNKARITLAVERLGNRQLGRAKRLEDNIKKNVKKTRCKSGTWTGTCLMAGLGLKNSGTAATVCQPSHSEKPNTLVSMWLLQVAICHCLCRIACSA